MSGKPVKNIIVRIMKALRNDTQSKYINYVYHRIETNVCLVFLNLLNIIWGWMSRYLKKLLFLDKQFTQFSL